MTPKEAKAYLMQYRESLDRTREIAEHLDELKAEAVRLKGHEGQRVDLDAAVARYVDACEESAHCAERGFAAHSDRVCKNFGCCCTVVASRLAKAFDASAGEQHEGQG